MSLLDVLNTIKNIRLAPFIAPVVEADHVFVWTLQNKIPYRMRVSRPRPGWWVMIPDSESICHIDEFAMGYQEVQYLSQLPQFNAIVLASLSEHTILGVPFNASDANQRGWHNGQPRLIHLPRYAAEPFDVIAVRDMGGVLLYDEINTRLGISALIEDIRTSVFGDRKIPDTKGITPDFRNAAKLILDRLADLDEIKREQDILAQNVSIEDKMRAQLRFMGADLNRWYEQGQNYRVTWTFDGQEYNMLVNKNMRVESAGICLDGEDTKFNLSAIVQVMQEARSLGRT
jgi:hypothetical protein